MTRMNSVIFGVGYKIPNEDEFYTNTLVNGNDQYLLSFDDRHIFSDFDVDFIEPSLFVSDKKTDFVTLKV